MAQFDPQRLLRSIDLNPRDRILSAISSRSSAMTSDLGGALGVVLAQVGQSIESATRFAAARTDALLSSAPSAFSSMAALGGGSPAIERISRSDLLNFRSGGEIPFDPQTVIPETQETGSFSDTKIFPSDLGDLEYRMELEFMEYQRPQLSGGADLEMRFKICLPIPNTLVEGYVINWSEGQYGPTVGNLINAVDLARAGGQITSEALLGTARGALQQTVTSGAGGLLGGIGVEAEGISGAVDQAFGSIVNPHVALFFKGIGLREHQFSWALAARNVQDSRNIKEIYYRIKRSALPTITLNAQSTTLEYPMMVRVKILTRGGKELYPFKTCVIPQISMNYASSGIPAFHTDGSAVLQQLNMTLKEIEYFTSDDIKNMQDDEYSEFEDDFAQTPTALNYFHDNFFEPMLSTGNSITQSIESNTEIISVFGVAEEEEE